MTIMFAAVPANAGPPYSNITPFPQPSDQYYQITGLMALYDYGSRFTNNAWMPVAPGEEPRGIIFSGQIYVTNAKASIVSGSPYAGAPDPVVRVVRNGDLATNPNNMAMIPNRTAAAPGSSGVVISAQFHAEPGDLFTLWLFVTNPDVIINGHPMHTRWFGGMLA